MKVSFPVVFGGLIAYILLLLYGITAAQMILEVNRCGAAQDCTTATFSNGVIYVVTTVGGLVSAMVVSKLAVTKPGENPTVFAGEETGMITTVLAGFFLVVWLAVGLGALVYGVMLHPDVNQPVADLGTSWLGLAVASGYAYLGLDPS